MRLPPLKAAAAYLLEVDGVWLPIPISRHMIVAVHANRPGVVLVLLSALASRGVNVVDLQLGARGDKNFAALGDRGGRARRGGGAAAARARLLRGVADHARER